MAKEKSEMLALAFERAVEATLATAKKVPPERRVRQLKPGKSHPLWLLGHMTVAMDSYANAMALGGTPELPRAVFLKFAPDFDGGQPIRSSATDYPSWDEVLANYERFGRRAVERIRALDDAELDGPGKGLYPGPFNSYFAVLGRTLTDLVAHDAYHRGQIGLLAALD